ncbi:MAG: transcriptional regulator NrdR [Nocardioides sp.]
MHCPYCRHTDTKVLDSRVSEDGTAIRRRRRCENCEKRFTTVELMQLTVVKRSGATEPFSREKAISGVRKACKGRPVSEDDLAFLGQTVEDALRSEGAAEVPSQEVGLAILGPLRALDPVAYLRFASVYKAFSSADDFAEEIALLRMEAAPLVEEGAREPLVEEAGGRRSPLVEEGALRPSRNQAAADRAQHAVPTG